MNRGNSIIAGVVLVGILGSLSIALQATAPTTENITTFQVKRQAQVAQVSGGVSVTKPPEKKDEDVLPVTCQRGHSYAVSQEGSKTSISCKRLESCTWEPGWSVNETDAQRAKAGVDKKCRELLNTPTKGNKSCENIECKVCVFLKQKNGTMKCVETAQRSKDGEFVPQKLTSKSLIDEYSERAKKGDLEAMKTLSGLPLDKQTGQGVFDAFDKAAIDQMRTVGEAETNVEACKFICNDKEKEEAAKTLASEQKKLDEIKAMQARLRNEQTGEVGPCPIPPCSTRPAAPTSPERPTSPAAPSGTQSPSGQQGPQQGRQASTFPQQQQQQNPYQQCSPQYFCQNNALYWGSPQQQQQAQQQQQPQYNFFTGSYTYPQQQQCQNQFVQACQYGCEQQQGTQYSTRCAQNPQQQTPTTPTASLSCGEGTLFDVGMSVPITFNCTNSVSSTGSGFSTGGVVPTGTASPVVQKPPAGSDIVSYGLTCTASNNQTASKRCDAKINVATIVMVANPKEVEANASTTVGWVTRGMKTCVISSPNAPSGSPLEEFNQDNADIENPSGVAVTPPLTAETHFTLSCVTKAGQQKSSTIKVRVKGS